MSIWRVLFRLTLGSRMPTTSGTLKVSGVGGEVVVRRDRYGIPYIEADSDEDAWYGLGFCQGQDRAFQLEMSLRLVRGTLSALAGPETLPLDRISRRIGFRRSAEEQLGVLGESERRTLEAFARGVNDGVRLGSRRLPHEFALLRADSTPFTPADTLGIVKVMSFAIAANWDSELVRLKILSEAGPDALKALDPTYPEWHHVIAPHGVEAGPAVERLAEDISVFRAVAGSGGASNNWVLAPSRTAAGRPILANDPHLEPRLPSYWYLAHLRTPDWAAAGASLAGAPAIVVGHNGAAAWGITAGLVDNTDLFVEEVGPDGRSVRQGDGFVPCEVRQETIEVRGQPEVIEEVLVTPRGPVISPALDGELGAISIKATWLEPKPVRAFLHVHRVRTFEEFRDVMADWPFASFGMVYADTSGRTGWQLVGEVPKRRKGYGTLPMPGWEPDAGWDDSPVSFDELPHAADTASGFLATANNQPAPAGEGPFLGIDWLPGYRHGRISEVLDSRKDWDVAGSMRLQMDLFSLPWREMKEAVLSAPAHTDNTRQALELLKGWDGSVSPDSAAATVFEAFIADMSRRVVEAKAPASARWALGMGFATIAPVTTFAVRYAGHLSRLLRQQPRGWFQRPWPEEIADSLDAVIKSLKERYGSSQRRWTWGRVRPLKLRHPAGTRKAFDSVFNRGPLYVGGDTNTVAQFATSLLDLTGDPLWVPSLRAVMDVGNWDDSRFVLPGGQSGNPMSRHYDDMLPLWLRGEGVPIAWSPGAVEQAAKETLRLEPT